MSEKPWPRQISSRTPSVWLATDEPLECSELSESEGEGGADDVADGDGDGDGAGEDDVLDAVCAGEDSTDCEAPAGTAAGKGQLVFITSACAYSIV